MHILITGLDRAVIFDIELSISEDVLWHRIPMIRTFFLCGLCYEYITSFLCSFSSSLSNTCIYITLPVQIVFNVSNTYFVGI